MTTASNLPKRLGKYEIRSLLGQGGMATVYLAYQSDIDREVAIKVLPPHPGQDPQFMDRFQQEARTIARLQHPHILPVFDFGVENEILYLVMPYVGGGSLKNLMQGRRLPPSRIVEVITDVASAIDYAHRQGVIHRDIKPDNILLDKEGNPILTDFGIAKLLESNVQFTASGGFLGTPAYMAPEQGRGVKDIDGRADIYALGVLAFEMLTGRHPYSAETPMMVMFKHVSDPVPSLLEVAPEYPPAVDGVLQRALAKDREARYQTATEFAKALASALAGQIDTAVGVSTAYDNAENIETLLVTDTPTGSPRPTQSISDQTIPPTLYYTASGQQRRSGFFIGAITVILLIALVSAGLLLLNRQDGEEADETGQSATETPSASETTVPVASANFGQVRFNTTNVTGDTVVFSTQQIQQPEANQVYQAWLYSSQDNRWLALGTLPVDVFGEAVLTFTSADSENLYTSYDGAAVSLEPSGTTPAAPSQILYSGVLLPEVSSALQQILVAWTPDDPNLNPRGLSLVDIARDEFSFAADHADRALSGAARGSGPNTRVHAEHVYNILNGTVDDINGDNSSGNNPSNLKVGLLPALTALDDLLIAALNAPGITPEQQAQIVTVQTCAENSLFALDPLVEQAQQFANVQDSEITNMVASLQTWRDAIAPLGPGQDVDGDSVIEPIEGECGIEGVRRFALFMNIILFSEGDVITQ